MLEINEKKHICGILRYDINIAIHNFLRYYNWRKTYFVKDPNSNLDVQTQHDNWKKNSRGTDCYLELYYQITKRIGKNLFEEDSIEIIYLSDELDESLLDVFINLIRKETHGKG